MGKSLVILFGPPAVGKMSVGAALSRQTGLPLFHNHMAIELVLPFFPFGSKPYNRLVPQIRKLMFDEVARSDLRGLIFTFVWALDDPDKKAFIDRLVATFTRAASDVNVCFVELAAPQDERLRRNQTPERLAAKPSKRDLILSRDQLLAADAEYRMNTAGDFFYPERHLRIENTQVSADDAARQIIARFGLATVTSV